MDFKAETSKILDDFFTGKPKDFSLNDSVETLARRAYEEGLDKAYTVVQHYAIGPLSISSHPLNNASRNMESAMGDILAFKTPAAKEKA